MKKTYRITGVSLVTGYVAPVDEIAADDYEPKDDGYLHVTADGRRVATYAFGHWASIREVDNAE